MGLVMFTMSITLILIAHNDRTTAWQRKETGDAFAIMEGGMARLLAQLSQAHNAPLLTLNYDTINPKTGKTYLGPDGIFNNGDEEEKTAVDEWRSLSATSSCTMGEAPNYSTSGTIGTGQYTLKSYRYNSDKQIGTLLMEGKQGESTSYMLITLSVNVGELKFPGILTTFSLYLEGRNVLGSNGNIYYNPAYAANTGLTGFSAPGEADRSQYLSALYSGPTDNIEGTIFACELTPTLAYTPPGSGGGFVVSNLGLIDGSMSLSGTSGQINVYTTEFDLDGTEILNIDTTEGPVHLYIDGPSILRGSSQIRNVRTDGQAPRVGDLRLIVTDQYAIELAGKTCIDTAFIYNPTSDVQLESLGDGCPSDGNTNIDGVVWAEDIDETIPGTSGIRVPDDVSSLSDILETVRIPQDNSFGGVLSWRRLYPE